MRSRHHRLGKRRAHHRVRPLIRVRILPLPSILGPQHVIVRRGRIALRQVIEEVEGEDVGMSIQVRIRGQPIGEGPRSGGGLRGRHGRVQRRRRHHRGQVRVAVTGLGATASPLV